MRFKIDWASLIVGRKFTVFALSYSVFEGKFQVQAPRGVYIWRGNLTEGFFAFQAFFWQLHKLRLYLGRDGRLCIYFYFAIRSYNILIHVFIISK